MSGPKSACPRSSRIAAALLGDLQDLLEQILDLEDLVGDVTEDLLEAPVLLAGAVAVEDVVEEELLHHRGTIRSISGPGRWTRTEFSRPISEVTWRLIGGLEERGIVPSGGAGSVGWPADHPPKARSS